MKKGSQLMMSVPALSAISGPPGPPGTDLQFTGQPIAYGEYPTKANVAAPDLLESVVLASPTTNEWPFAQALITVFVHLACARLVSAYDVRPYYLVKVGTNQVSSGLIEAHVTPPDSYNTGGNLIFDFAMAGRVSGLTPGAPIQVDWFGATDGHTNDVMHFWRAIAHYIA